MNGYFVCTCDFDLKWLLHKTEQNSEQKIEAKPMGPSVVAP